MEARMTQPAMVNQPAMKALLALGASTRTAGIPQTTLELVNLRASQINGCALCAQMHGADLRKAGETDDRMVTVATWRDAPYFTEAERAALALTEAVTRLADKPDAVPDDVWNDAAQHYDEEAMAALVIAIASINVWNRLNVATRQVAGAYAG